MVVVTMGNSRLNHMAGSTGYRRAGGDGSVVNGQIRRIQGITVGVAMTGGSVGMQGHNLIPAVEYKSVCITTVRTVTGVTGITA